MSLFLLKDTMWKQQISILFRISQRLFLIRVSFCFILFNSFINIVILASQQRIYVSSSIGCDDYDGLKENTPVRSINRALMLGDTILLKANDVFYECATLKGQYMSRYGEGNNPEINGLRTLTGRPWIHVNGNIWKIDLTSAESNGYWVQGTSELNNIGCFYENDKDVLHGRKCSSKEDLLHNWDFYQTNIETYKSHKNNSFDYLYLYLDENPNGLFLSLSIGSHYGLKLYNSTVEKVSVKGFGTGGINLSGSSNVKYCNVDIIGGSMMLHGNTTVCLGNGIDFWVSQDAYDCVIEENCITRCFDCGCSIQASGQGQATPRNIVFRNNIISNCCQGWEDFLRNDDNVMYENCVFEENVVFNIGNCSGFGYSDNRFKYCHILGNNIKGNKGMIIQNNIFVGGNYYCSGAYNNEYKSNVWRGNTCYIKRGDFILSNYGGTKDVIRIPFDKGHFLTLKAATDDAISRYRMLTGDETTLFVVKNEKDIKRRIKKLERKYLAK